MAVSISNLKKNDSMYICLCAEEVYLHMDEGKVFVHLCEDISSHFILVEQGGRVRS